MNDRRKPKAKRSGGLSPEERELWRQVNRETVPLKGRDYGAGAFAEMMRREQEGLPSERPEKPVSPRPRPQLPTAQRLPLRSRKTTTQPNAREELLSHGSSAGLDRRNAERLKRGKMVIEATLDLHGMSQVQAQSALGRFIQRSEAGGLRCVLVITGKGLAKESGGVLRNQVPNWLNDAGNRERIVAFNYAQQGHGGTGALYVLLKRRRDAKRR
ncbi:Smr/MutS family protein [Pelagibius sp. Alg239-R121]|uniref:Smr/MutS family protein n=1 Tax=Pelagibius sp. Alg239-R121 TaxID=2993448 RepID=UPI0024A68F9A|nr:Smr/MutS family protein [Pelagibius sp. Alg239-R121]